MRVYRLALVLGVALVMGWLSARLLFNGSVWNIVPWGVLAFATAFVAASRREAWGFGALFGFVVSYAFLAFNYAGAMTVARILVVLAISILPSLFGALCGAVAARLGWWARLGLSARQRHGV